VRDAFCNDVEVFEYLLEQKVSLLTNVVQEEHQQTRETIKEEGLKSRKAVASVKFELTETFNKGNETVFSVIK
jgi:hypothetical protein